MKETPIKYTHAPHETGDNLVPRLWYRDAQASGLSSEEELGSHRLPACSCWPRGLWGLSSTHTQFRMCLLNSGHQYLTAFLHFHHIVSGAGSYFYKDKRARNIAKNCSVGPLQLGFSSILSNYTFIFERKWEELFGRENPPFNKSYSFPLKC